jgi:ABC-type branched-subunit amino acid transport system substrate-binding protein
MPSNEKPEFRVHPQGRVYGAIIGVVVGMLVAGLGVPLTFGRVSGSGGTQQDGLSSSPGATFAPTDDPSDLPSAAPSSGPLGGVPTVGPAAPSTGTGSTTGTTGISTTGGTTDSTSGATTRLAATDQGVTATTVRLGVVLLDIQALEPLGFGVPHYSPQDQQEQYQAFIDEVNKSGGLLGRRLVPVYKTFNALDNNGATSAGAVCAQLAEDERVFAAVGILGSGINECLGIQHAIPSITDGAEIAEAYRKSNHLIISPLATLERGAANWGDMTFRAGLLTGHKSGTVYGDAPDDSRPEGALVQALKADGHTVTYRAKLSADASTAQSQIPVEIRKMQSAGVDTVFLSTNFVLALQWVQSAEQQNYRPRYMVSDVGALTAEGLVRNMGSSFDNAYAFTGHTSVLPEGPEDGACRKTFNTGTGNRYAAGNESPGLRAFCGMIKEFAAGARAAGPNLTRPAFARAVQGLGSLSLPAVLRGSFTSGKTDFGDWQRPMRWALSCRCYRDAGPAQRNRY